VPQCADDQGLATAVANLLEVLYLRGDLLDCMLGEIESIEASLPATS
jgi:hypothetical protein